LPQLSYSRVVEEGLPEGEQSQAPGFRQTFDDTNQRTASAILPTAHAAVRIAPTTSGETLPALAHRASDAATRLASGLEGRAAARPPLRTTYPAANALAQFRDGSPALKTMRADSAVARCAAILRMVAAHQETFLNSCQKN
jgi:hypothetical protein